MKINKNLEKIAGFNPTKRTYQISILNICEKIENQEITLPLYQRDVSWTLQKSVDLMNYQLLGKAPVAPISINEINKIEHKPLLNTNESEESTHYNNYIPDYVLQVSFIDREIVENVKKGQLSVADGQQRLTTNFKAYKNDDEFRNVVLDLTKGCFLIIESAIKKNQVPIGILLNKDNSIFFNYLNNNSLLKDPKVMNLLLQIRTKLQGYNYTVNLAEDLTEDEQIEWFEVLNNAGSRVTRVQMRFSKLKANGIDIYKQYTKPFIDKIESLGFYDLFPVKATEVSIPIAALNSAYEIVIGKNHSLNYTPIPSDTRENQIALLDSNQIKKCLDLTLSALDNALKFIDSNNLFIPNRIDYITYLTGFFVFKNSNSLTEKEKLELIDWYKTVNFTNKSNSERRVIFSSLLEKIIP
ncbi:DUF262 domain-containing protein [Clostridium perfringens]|nr:DUF262 domain-containing protein [Clostridium perfringens]